MIRNENMEKTLKARSKILEVLSDGQWHQTKDLKVYTKVSPRTLYKHLEALEAYIEKEKDETTYPHRVYYRANQVLLSLMAEAELTEAFIKDVIANLSSTKDLTSILKFINTKINMGILLVLETIKKSGLDVANVEQISFLMRSFVLTPFEYAMAGIVKATTKIIDDIDFEQVRKDLKKE